MISSGLTEGRCLRSVTNEDKLDQYAILSKMGEYAFASVWRAERISDHRVFAIKQVHRPCLLDRGAPHCPPVKSTICSAC